MQDVQPVQVGQGLCQLQGSQQQPVQPQDSTEVRCLIQQPTPVHGILQAKGAVKGKAEGKDKAWGDRAPFKWRAAIACPCGQSCLFEQVSWHAWHFAAAMPTPEHHQRALPDRQSA